MDRLLHSAIQLGILLGFVSSGMLLSSGLFYDNDFTLAIAVIMTIITAWVLEMYRGQCFKEAKK